MNLRSSSLRALLFAPALIIHVSSHAADIPQVMQRDFVTSHNSVLMKWNPQGYWSSKPGAFIGTGSTKEVCEIHTQSALSRGKIPKGFRFYVSTTGQFVACDRPIQQLATARPSMQPSAPAPLPAPASPMVAPTPTPPATQVFQDPDSIPVRRAAIIDDSPPHAQSRSPFSPAPSAVPAPKRTAVLDPVHAAPSGGASGPMPVVSSSSLPIPPSPDDRPEINGIPGSMQTSFLSRHDSVFMTFDKKAGKWHSSEGAIGDVSTADDWCKQATIDDRQAKRIPATFSYKHVGAGQVEATRD